MSKIPQGEWSVIAERYARGESLSAIARSYGCTPPAIHYVLKRNGRQASVRAETTENEEKVEQPVAPAPPISHRPPPEVVPTPRPNGAMRLALKPDHEPAEERNRRPELLPGRPAPAEQRPVQRAPSELLLHPGS